MADYAVFRGRGGGLHRFKLPLSPAFAAQEAKGYLVRVDDVDEDPRPARRKADPEQKPEPEQQQSGHSGRPGRNDSKHDWVAWAVSISDLTADEANAMTKADLVDQFG